MRCLKHMPHSEEARLLRLEKWGKFVVRLGAFPYRP